MQCTVSCANLRDYLSNSRVGAGGNEAGDQGPGGVRWQYFSEAGYIAGDSLRGGEDKYARNKFNQVSVCEAHNVYWRVSTKNNSLMTTAWRYPPGLIHSLNRDLCFSSIKNVFEIRCPAWIQGIETRVKIRYLVTLKKRWVMDFEFFDWNPSGPSRTIT